ncbi:MAG: Glu/Leu/Phe/Val dehydrogenase dimerization domain-containing protein [Gemmatimonadales bacterium]|jgi:glutamate dehydrogenase/leucine dehydrogenase
MEGVLATETRDRQPAERQRRLSDVWHRYARYVATPPETAIEWNDSESGARGWLALNSLRGGAAGGGTRMRSGLGRDEVVYLAKVMELKFALSGPPIGGAKSGIAFDPSDPRKEEVLGRWFTAINPYLRSVYGTAGDLNVDEGREVLPICGRLGLAHPQEGALRGHYGLHGKALARRLRAMNEGMGQKAGPPFSPAGWNGSVSDLVTGYGVASAAKHLLELQGRDVEGVRVLIEGFGCVGGGAAHYLAEAGARIVGIVDVANGLVVPEGLDATGVSELLARRKLTELPVSSAEAGKEGRTAFRQVPADIFVTAAASGTLTAEALDQMENQGVRAIICGSNVPFAAVSPEDTALQAGADTRFAIVADFIANLGAAHAFAFQMERDDPASVSEFFDAVASTVEDALDEAQRRAGSAESRLLAAALDMALERISAPTSESG